MGTPYTIIAQTVLRKCPYDSLSLESKSKTFVTELLLGSLEIIDQICRETNVFLGFVES